jgi:hypothetical protein
LLVLNRSSKKPARIKASQRNNQVSWLFFCQETQRQRRNNMPALAAGVASLSAVTDTTASLSATAATGGTAPYTYQWYRSLITGFTPGAGTLITGATALTLNDSALIPNTTYFYVLVATDSASATVNYTQVTALTQAMNLSQNQFSQTPYVGMPDMRFNASSIGAQVSPNQATALYNGMAVKIDTAISPNGSNYVPQVIGCTANSDSASGFIIYDIKSLSYNAGDRISMALAGTVLYLWATSAITAFNQVQLNLQTGGGVTAKVGASGANIVGYAIDGASASGQLIRVFVQTPSFTFA